MAIAFDAVQTGTPHTVANSTTLTFAHTCTGTNRILFVAVTALSARTISSVTYNGVALTLVNRSAGGQPVATYYMVAPATGSNNVVITIDSSSFIYAGSVSYTGASQTNQPNSNNTTTATSTSVTTSTTVVASNCWMILGARNEDSGDTNAGTGSTERSADNPYMQVYDSNGTVGTGSQSMTVTNGGSHSTATSIVSFFPSGLNFTRTSTTVNPASNTVAFNATATDGYLVVQTLKASNQTVSAVTYNGVSMTLLVGPNSDGTPTQTNYLWGLAAPATGTNNIVVTDSGAGTLVVDAILYSGAQQTTAVEATNINSGVTATTASVSVTTITDNAWLVGYFRSNSASGSFTAGSNTVIRTDAAEGTRQLADTGADQTPAGSKTITATMALAANWSALAFSLKPYVAPATANGNFFMFM